MLDDFLGKIIACDFIVLRESHFIERGLTDDALPRLADLPVEIVQLVQFLPQPLRGTARDFGVPRFDLLPKRRLWQRLFAKFAYTVQKIVVDIGIALVRAGIVQPLAVFEEDEIFQIAIPDAQDAVKSRVLNALFDVIGQAKGQNLSPHAPTLPRFLLFEGGNHTLKRCSDRLYREVRFSIRGVKQVFRPVAQREQVRVDGFFQFLVIDKMKTVYHMSPYAAWAEVDLCGQGEVPVVVRLKLCKNAVAFQEGGDGEDARLHVVTSVGAYDNGKMIVLRNGCGIAQSVPIPVAAQCIDIVKLAPIDVGGGKPAIAVDRPFAAFGDQLFRIGIGDCPKELFVIGYGALMAGRDAFLGTLCVVKWQIPVISLLQSSQFIIRRGHCVIRLGIDQRAILLIVGDVFSVALLHDKARNEVCSVQVIQPLVVCKEHAAIAVCLDDVDFGIKGVFVGNVPITAKKIIDGYGVKIGKLLTATV